MTRTEQIKLVMAETPKGELKLALARLLVSWGLYLFPIAANGKKPPSREQMGIPEGEPAGHLIASNKADDIEAWYGEHPEWNIGINCELSGLVVIDPDLYKDGCPEEWAKVSAELGMLETFAVSTPHGGMHYYTASNGHRVGSEQDWRPGIDCKAIGGYVVAPGCEVDGKRYEPESPFDVVELPDAWAAALPEPKAGGDDHDDHNDDSDNDDRNDMRTMLDRPANGERYNKLLRVAMCLRNRDLPKSWTKQFIEMLGERYGLKAEGRDRDIRRAWESAFEKPARDVPTQPDLEPPPAEVSDGSERRELRALDLHEVMDGEPQPVPWIIPDWLACGDYVVLGGEPKSGKSWLALYTSLLLAGAGRDWLGRGTPQGAPRRVLYVDEEQGEALVQRRLHKLAGGLTVDRGEIAKLPLHYLYRNSLNLESGDDLQALFRVVESFEPDVIVLDSMVRLHRSDENDNSAMRSFYASAIQPLVSNYKCTVLTITHLNKPSDRHRGIDLNRVRGASEIAAPADAIWMLETRRDRPPLLHFDRGRWGEPPDPIEVSIRDVGDGVTVSGTVPSDTTEDRLPIPSQTIHAFLSGSGEPVRVHVIASQTSYHRNTVTDHLKNHLLPRGMVEDTPEGWQALHVVHMSTRNPGGAA